MTPTDTATRAAEALMEQDEHLSWRLRTEMESKREAYKERRIKEIAAILRPFMETKEDKDEKEAVQIIGRTLVHFRDLSRDLSDEGKRKDEEIAALKEKLGCARDWITANTDKPVHDLMIYLTPPVAGTTVESK